MWTWERGDPGPYKTLKCLEEGRGIDKIRIEWRI